VQFLLALAAAAVSLVFFVLRIVQYARDCDVGSQCKNETTTYAVATVVSLLLALLALLLVVAIARCSLLPASILLPAPAPHRKKNDEVVRL
jgi:hypothetical protein